MPSFDMCFLGVISQNDDSFYATAIAVQMEKESEIALVLKSTTSESNLNRKRIMWSEVYLLVGNDKSDT